MRLWSLHPRYLDPQGLNALWREGLLAQKVLQGLTKGYKNHPQLARFKAKTDPLLALSHYLNEIWYEASTRGYKYNAGLIQSSFLPPPQFTVTQGQLDYEWQHLLAKLKTRSPGQHEKVKDLKPEPYPMFKIVPGEIETWERPRGER